MSDHCPPTDHRKVAATRDGDGRRFLLGLVVLTLIGAGEVMAADQPVDLALTPDRNDHRATAPIAAPPLSTPFATPFVAQSYGGPAGERLGRPPSLLPAPQDYSLPPAADVRSFSSKDFRPRGHSVFDTDPSIANGNANLMSDRTVWQRLQEYRNHDKVQVITLWESGASAVSIQTNRKGDPTLQWTSRLMNRGGATRGLFDRWMPATMFRSFSRSSASPSSKPSASLAAPHSGMSAIP
jgi:hypothetical protein